ncbi:MAG: hypothetical protein JWR16_2020 [Nevskia sp.]|nr:hypothetical protein [Nevskia sp.]
MLLDPTLAYLHFLSIIATAATLVAEAVLLRPSLIAQSGRWLARVDIAYFVAVIAAIASGFSRAIWGAKGWEFYAHNPAFRCKLGLFIVIGLVSIPPTLQFMRWARAFRGDPAYMVPAAELKRARRFVLIELHLLALLPLFAVMMSRHLWF